MGALRWCAAGLAALVVSGCSSDGAYTCSDASMCMVGQVAGICQATGYCSFPDGTCDSGQRYGEFAGAGLADECVPPGVAETETNEPDTSTTGDSSTTTLGTTSGPTTNEITTDSTTTMEPGPLSDTGDESSSTTGIDPTTITTTASDDSGSESSSGDPKIPAPPCADFNFEDASGAGANLPSVAMFDDQFSTSCYPGEHIDVVFYWVAPVSATYEFSAEVNPADSLDVAGTLRHTCDGEELVCDDDGGGGLDTLIVRDVTAGEEFLYAVTVNGDLGEGFQMSISQK